MLKQICKITACCLLSALFLLMGYGGASAEQRAESPLRIGVAPDNPPIIFTSNGQMKGLEADLAVQLGKDLDRPIEFVKVPWDGLIGALIKGDIDIIMSGMTITEARKVRIAFSEPYLKSGLLAAMRARDKQKYTSLDSIIKAFPNIGVVRGTTGEAFVRKNIPRAGRVVHGDTQAGPVGPKTPPAPCRCSGPSANTSSLPKYLFFTCPMACLMRKGA